MSDFQCLECAEGFDTRDDLDTHWRAEGHGPAQVALDAVDRARYSIMGSAAPPPVSAYEPDGAYQQTGLETMGFHSPLTRRRRFQVMRGGKR